MPTRLRQLKVKRVDLVDKGANQEAHVVLFKRDEGSGPPSRTTATKGGKDVSVYDRLMQTLSKSLFPRTTSQIVDDDLKTIEITGLFSAFTKSLSSILEAGGSDVGPLTATTIGEFAGAAKQAISKAESPDNPYIEGAVDELLAVREEIIKAGRVMSGANIKRLKSALEVLNDLLSTAMPPEADPTNKSEEEPMPASIETILAKLDDDEKNLLLEALGPEDEEGESEGEGEGEGEGGGETEEALLSTIAALTERAERAEAQIAKAAEEAALREEITKAEALKPLGFKPEDIGPLMRKLRATDPEAAGQLEKTLTSVADAVKAQNVLFTEIGKSTSGDDGDPMSKAKALAAELRKEDKSLTDEQAIAKAFTDNPALYNEYMKNRG